MCRYSEKEREMFTILGWGTHVGDDGIEAYGQEEERFLYEKVVLYIFVNDLQGGAVEAVRRTMRAIIFGRPERNTPEFDALIYGLDDPPLNQDI